MNTMKALSLWQPWASAVANGAKCVETRSWSTTYRGLLAIHAAQKDDRHLRRACLADSNVRAALNIDRGVNPDLPRGVIIAVVELVDVRPAETFTSAELDVVRTLNKANGTFTERSLGNFAAGRFGWVFRNLIEISTPVPYKGRQGLFNVPPELFGK